MKELPNGAIENGRENMRRLVEHYNFECEAGPLSNCVDFCDLQRSFEVMAEWILETAIDAEEQRAEMAREQYEAERREIENREMEDHFRRHPHG